jgi:hypothetical protein
MDARMNTERDQLVAELSKAAQLHVCSNDDGRVAAIFQLSAILKFLEADIHTKCLTTPLHVLLTALVDVHKGGKPAKILTPQKPGHRQRDDVALQTIKVVAAVIMDQLCGKHSSGEHLSREEAAKEVVKVFAQYRLSKFRGRDISATAVTKWRDLAKERQNPELTHQFNRLRAMDIEVLGKDAPLERKRELLLKVRLPQLLVEFGEAQGPKALEARQHLIKAIEGLIPKKPIS